MPNEEGDAVREYKAMHEENFLSRWLRENVRGKEERAAKASEKNEEERGEKRKREEDKEENQTRRVKKEEGTVCFLWRCLKSLVKEEIWRVVVMNSCAQHSFLSVTFVDQSVGPPTNGFEHLGVRAHLKGERRTLPLSG